MDLSWVILVCGAATLILALIFAFFGYKLARFLLPLCGVAVVLGTLWAFALPALKLNTLAAWLFLGGSGVSVYILLFFFKRVAGFFAGLAGAALLLIYIAFAFDLSTLPYLYPICFTLCVVSGLLAVVYRKGGVIYFTSLLGACAAIYAGLYLFIEGVNAGAFVAGVLPPLAAFLTAQKYLVLGASLVLTVIGMLVQAAVTSKNQVLPGQEREAHEPKQSRDYFDEPEEERLPERPASDDPPEMDL